MDVSDYVRCTASECPRESMGLLNAKPSSTGQTRLSEAMAGAPRLITDPKCVKLKDGNTSAPCGENYFFSRPRCSSSA